MKNKKIYPYELARPIFTNINLKKMIQWKKDSLSITKKNPQPRTHMIYKI